MSEVKEIRLHRVELKLADTDDPIASKVSWDPLKRGGASFTTQRFKSEPGQLRVVRTIGATVFALVFAVPGTLAVLGAIPAAIIADEGLILGGFLFVWGLMFGGAGWFLLLGNKPLTFDARRGVYYRGKAYDPRLRDVAGSGHGPLARIHALQLISERVHSRSRSGSSTYTSHELNLVFEDAERMNVMDHGGDVESAARQLAGLLNVPVWKATY